MISPYASTQVVDTLGVRSESFTGGTRMSNRRFAASVILALALLTTSLTFGQVASRLSGNVKDASGAAVPGATVDVYLPGGEKPILTQTTTADGLFAFT